VTAASKGQLQATTSSSPPMQLLRQRVTSCGPCSRSAAAAALSGRVAGHGPTALHARRSLLADVLSATPPRRHHQHQQQQLGQRWSVCSSDSGVGGTSSSYASLFVAHTAWRPPTSAALPLQLPLRRTYSSLSLWRTGTTTTGTGTSSASSSATAKRGREVGVEHAVARLTALRTAGRRAARETGAGVEEVPALVGRTAVRSSEDAERLLYALAKLADHQQERQRPGGPRAGVEAVEMAHALALRRMREAGVPMNINLYHMCLRFHRRSQEQAHRLLEDLLAQGVRPTAATFDVRHTSPPRAIASSSLSYALWLTRRNKHRSWSTSTAWDGPSRAGCARLSSFSTGTHRASLLPMMVPSLLTLKELQPRCVCVRACRVGRFIGMGVEGMPSLPAFRRLIQFCHRAGDINQYHHSTTIAPQPLGGLSQPCFGGG
jgi:hypothetical protein